MNVKLTRSSILPKLSVSRPVTVTMAFIALLVLGIITYVLIPIKLLPSGFTPPLLGVWVDYPNSNPSETEEKIARPI